MTFLPNDGTDFLRVQPTPHRNRSVVLTEPATVSGRNFRIFFLEDRVIFSFSGDTAGIQLLTE